MINPATKAEADDPIFGPGPDTEDEVPLEDLPSLEDEEADDETGLEDAPDDIPEENGEEHRGRSELVAAGARRQSPSRDRRAW